MRPHRGAIFLGDLARAVQALSADGPLDAHRLDVIARALGFHLPVRAGPGPEFGPIAPPPSPADRVEPQPEPATVPATPPVAVGLDGSAPPESVKRPLLEAEAEGLSPELAPLAFDFEHIPADSTPVPTTTAAAPLDWGRGETAPMEIPPLLEPLWERGIYTQALRSERRGREPDLDALVDAMARLQDPGRVPPARERGPGQGCQLLLDRGEGMQPFRRDMEAARRRIAQVVGLDALQVLGFRACPLFGVEGPDDLDPVTYLPPPAGTSVFVFTDLGLARPAYALERASGRDWLRFAGDLRSAGCRLVAWVPYSRWPHELSGAFPIVPLDRGTSIRTVIEALGRPGVAT